ncbi:MAG: 50S ribosomal protein L19e [Thermoprotei archaeon]|nr:50S ribosomal protein L19e [Thermoprotei archaeon]
MTAEQLTTIRRMAASILGVGVHRVWIDPERIEDVLGAVTREDVRKLIKDGVIKAKPKKGVSRVRARERHRKKKRGQRRGPGSRKGSRVDSKRMWVVKIRAIRRFLKYLRRRRIITRRTYRMLYRKAKGGEFASIASLKMYIRERNLARR